MGIDVVRSRALNRVLAKYPSDALEADALHFSTDVWSTFVVILGISGAWLGMSLRNRVAQPIGRRGGAGRRRGDHLDGSRLGKRTADALLDVAPQGLRERIETAVGKTEGVLRSLSACACAARDSAISWM